MAERTANPKLVIISGPSGVGKSTVVKDVLAESSLPLALSVSATTRAPRPGEVDGADYHFLTRDEFARRKDAGEFLECKEVHGRGDWYGTLRKTVEDGLAAGSWVVLEIDVEGMKSVVERYPQAISIFIHLSSIDELERRLRKRNTETEVSLQRRLEAAAKELACLSNYKYDVVNDQRDEAVRNVCEILLKERGA